MEIVTLIYIVFAIAFGAIVMYFILRNKKSEITDKTEDSIQSFAENKLAEEYEQKVQDYENQISNLDKQLKEVLNKSTDELVKLQLVENEYLKNEIKDREVDLAIEKNNLLSENNELQNKISNYDSKIKGLEEDIEDYEDDIASEKRKLTEKNIENEELQDTIRKYTITNRELNEEIKEIKFELKEKTEENNLKSNSLNFIEEILSAEELKKEEIAEYEPIDNMVEYIEKLRDRLTVDRQILKRWSITQKKHWLKNKITIAFVGEFSAGKTSIVNRILSQDDPNVPLLPVNTKPTTAIPTYISRGVSTQYRFVSPDHVLKDISEKIFMQVSKEVLDQIKGATNLISHFVMSYKNDNLQNLSMLDTPGFNSNDKKDAERTIAVINECDALFWVMDVNSGAINKSSIDLIRNHLQKPLYVVINKVDTKATSEVQKVEQLMRATFKNAGIPVKEFIHFSAKADLYGIMKPILSVKNNNGQDFFLENISSQLEQLEKQNELLVENAKYEKDKEISKVHKLTDELVSVLQDLQQNCEKAASIPKWTEHVFKKDRYEMTVEEGSKLGEILTFIYETQVNDITNIYNEQLDSVSKAQESIEIYYNNLESLSKINDFQKNFTKLKQPLI